MEAQHLIQRTLRDENALARVRSFLHSGEIVHRTALAERVCADFGFLDARGRTQRSSCLKALRRLEREGKLALPAPRTRPGIPRPRRLGEPVPPPQEVPEQLDQIQGLKLVRVDDDHHRQVWTELMAREHPRGAGPLVGCQLRYLIGSVHGWLGGLGFAAAALTLADRDRWIGWNPDQRRAQLHRIVGLARFLIRPSVRCQHLASHILARALRVLGRDFESRFGYRPWLVESFVDPADHEGVCFRAANWKEVGLTQGRGRQDDRHTCEESLKAIYLYPVERRWRERMGVGPEPPGPYAPLAPGEGLDGDGWAQNEFRDAPLGDKRLSKRLVDSARRQAEEPMRAFTGVAKTDWPAVKGYYRLIDQPAASEVTLDNILRPHRDRTIARMQALETVLCVQDGTDLNYTTHAHCTDLGVIGTNQTGAKSRGLHLHSTLAVSTDGLPLGVLRAHVEAPAPDGPGPKKLEQKKSFRWIEGLRDCGSVAKKLRKTRVVSVMDREADLFDLFVEHRQDPCVDILVRAKHDRRINDKHTLFSLLRKSRVQGELDIVVGRQSARPKSSKQKLRVARAGRTARLALRYRQVDLTSSTPEHRDQAPIAMWVVHVREQRPPSGSKRVEWFLLTTLPVASTEEAEQILNWYCLRWRIEDWHRVLKTGCRVEKLAHHHIERMERALAIRFVIAWRVMLMTLLGRECPGLPPELLFSDLEITVLQAFAKSRRLPPPSELGAAVRLGSGKK